MTSQEKQVLDMVIGQIQGLAEEVRGYRADLNGRLRGLEQREAARDEREKMEGEQGMKRLRRRDIYVPLIITNLVAVLGFITALKFR